MRKRKNTSLHKMMIYLGIGWSLFILLLGVWLGLMDIKNSRTQVKGEARVHFLKDQAFRLWRSTHGGVYVSPTEKAPPNPYQAHVPDRDVHTSGGKKLTLINPAYMMRLLMEDFGEIYGVKSRLTSLTPLRKQNAPDAWEKKALEAFKQGAREVMEFTQIDNEPYLRYMSPTIVVESCRNCLSNIIDSMPSALVGMDKDGNVTQWNLEAEKNTGVSAPEALGNPLNTVFPRLSREMGRIKKAVRLKEVQQDKKRLYQQEHEIRYEDVTIYPLITDGVEGAVIRIDDVTEGIRIEEMMIQSERSACEKSAIPFNY